MFVLERADTMNDEAANSLLKTLEEPPPYVVLLLLTDRPTQVLPTISSRCQPVRFDPLPVAELAQRLQSRGVAPDAADACARLSLGDGERALALALGDGPALRARAEAFARAPAGRPHATPSGRGGRCSTRRARAGAAAKEQVEVALAEELAYLPKKEHKRRETEFTDRARRAERRATTRRARPRAPARRALVPRRSPAWSPAPTTSSTTATALDALREDADGREHGALLREGRARRRHPGAAGAERQRGAGAGGARLPARDMTEVHVHGPHATVRLPGFEDEVAVEEPLEIRVDGAPLAVTMRTPGHDEELALGFLYGEGLIDGPRAVGPPEDLAGNTVEVTGPLLRAVGARSFYTSSSCGVCGKGALEEVAVHSEAAIAGPSSRATSSPTCPSGCASRRSPAPAACTRPGCSRRTGSSCACARTSAATTRWTRWSAGRCGRACCRCTRTCCA